LGQINYAGLMDQSFGELSLAGYSVDWKLPEDLVPNAATVSVAVVSNTSPQTDNQTASPVEAFRLSE